MDLAVGLLEFNSAEQIESIALRDLVLRKPLGLKFDPIELQNESDQLHVGAMIDGDVIGVLLLVLLAKNAVKMRQVAVHPDFQSKGIGKEMVRFSEELCRAMGKAKMELNARIGAVEFYKSLDYRTIGEEFIEVGIPHYRMEKLLISNT